MENLIIYAIIVIVVLLFVIVVWPVLAKKLSPTLSRLKGSLSKKGLSWDVQWENTQQAIYSMSPKSNNVPAGTLSFPFKLSELRIFPLLCLYGAVKSIQAGKGIRMPDFVRKAFPDKITGTHVIEGLASTAVGVLMMFEGLIGLKGYDTSGGSNTLTRITKCPNEIQRAVETELNNRLTKEPIDQQYKANLMRWKKAIDDYFMGL